MEESQETIKKDFIEFNRTRIRENALKLRHTSHVNRARGLSNHRRGS
jgi:hypothetical protein